MKLAANTWIVTGAVAFAALLPACASSGGGNRPAGSSADVITFEELQEDPSMELLALIESVRPRWLRGRGTSTLSGQTPPAVIIDGQVQPGRVDALRAIRVTDVQEVRYMNAGDATTRYGPGMISGAILVTRRNR